MLSLNRRRAARAHRAGRKAENAVDRVARGNGWTPLAANFQARGGELDRIYLGVGHLIVVEVRYRSRSDYGHAAETVTRTKRERIVRSTQEFLLANPKYNRYAVRFDVVGVNADGALDWIESAFEAG